MATGDVVGVVSRLKIKGRRMAMSNEAMALVQIKDLVDRITVVAKDGGRESGLTAGDRAQYQNAFTEVAKALDAGTAAQKALNEVKDDLATLRAELDQVKAEMSANPVE